MTTKEHLIRAGIVTVAWAAIMIGLMLTMGHFRVGAGVAFMSGVFAATVFDEFASKIMRLKKVQA